MPRLKEFKGAPWKWVQQRAVALIRGHAEKKATNAKNAKLREEAAAAAAAKPALPAAPMNFQAPPPANPGDRDRQQVDSSALPPALVLTSRCALTGSGAEGRRSGPMANARALACVTDQACRSRTEGWRRTGNRWCAG